jgi:tRNA A-37 threonylcarbamoyl transferase component Bud32
MTTQMITQKEKTPQRPKNLSPLLKKSPEQRKISDLDLKYISGPVSWTGFAFGKTEMHFFGDRHFSYAGSCLDLGAKTCFTGMEKEIRSDCMTIDGLIHSTFMSCEKNGIHADLFFESYHQSKKNQKKRILAQGKGSFIDVDKIVNEIWKQDTKNYIKVNNIDTRFKKFKFEKEIDPLKIIYSRLNEMLTSSDLSHPYILNKVYEVCLNILKSLKDDDMIYMIGDTSGKINNMIESLKDLKERNKDDDVYIGAIDIILDQFKKNKVILRSEKFKQKNITFENKNIGELLENYIVNKIKQQIGIMRERINQKDNGNQTTKLNNLTYIIECLLKMSSYLMDHYALYKMLKSIQDGSQLLITYTGVAHILTYIDFFKNVLKIKPMSNEFISNSDLNLKSSNPIRCVKNPKFGEIFGKWIDPTLFPFRPETQKIRNPEIEVLGPNKNYAYNSDQLINSGNFGDVYLGINYENGEELAIKVLKETNKEKNKSIYDQEVKCLKKILKYCDEYGLICLRDAFEQYDKYFIITPYLRNYIPLRQFIENYRYTSDITIGIIQWLDNIINVLHSSGVTHGDLNYDNIMINSTGFIMNEKGVIVDMNPFDIRLIDFGLCDTQSKDVDNDKLEDIRNVLSNYEIDEEESKTQVYLPKTVYS